MESSASPCSARADASNEGAIASFLLERYGPLIGREDLARILGFPNAEAFDRYVQRGHLSLRVVRLPNRRGVYALAPEVAMYLVEVSQDGVAVGRKERDIER